MNKNTTLWLGVACIAGAWFYSRRAAAATAPGTLQGAAPLGVGSMPGSAGTGVQQVLGGAIGNLLAPITGGGTSTGAPPTQDPNTVQYAGDDVLNNSVPAADPNATFDPTLGDLGALTGMMA